jgi:thymidylate kinase
MVGHARAPWLHAEAHRDPLHDLWQIEDDADTLNSMNKGETPPSAVEAMPDSSANYPEHLHATSGSWEPLPGQGQLIVLEGPDDVGKTTLATELVTRLRENGVQACSLAFPGREPRSLGALVYELHHEPMNVGVHRLDSISLQLLHIAAHVDAIEQRIRPALASGEWVVLDRFWWSTWVYGSLAGIAPEILTAVLQPELLVWRQLEPALVFLIERDEMRVQPDDEWAFRRLVESYRSVARKQKGIHPVQIVTNDDCVSIVTQRLLHLVNKYIGVTRR